MLHSHQSEDPPVSGFILKISLMFLHVAVKRNKNFLLLRKWALNDELSDDSLESIKGFLIQNP